MFGIEIRTQLFPRREQAIGRRERHPKITLIEVRAEERNFTSFQIRLCGWRPVQPHARAVQRMVTSSQLAARSDDKGPITLQQRSPRRAVTVERVADL